MATVFGRWTLTAGVAVVADTAKTVVQLVAPASGRVLLQELTICFDGTFTSTDTFLVEILNQTAATGGTYTAGTAYNGWSYADAIQGTIRHSCSSEPATSAALWTFFGSLATQRNFHREFGNRLSVAWSGVFGIRVTCTKAATVRTSLAWEE